MRPIRPIRSTKPRTSLQRWPHPLRLLLAFDWPLLTILLLMAALGMVIMHSAVGSMDGRFSEQLRNFLLAFAAMWAAALVPPKLWLRWAPACYFLGIVLLLGVELAGDTSKGATRWLDLGVARIQPSEILKIAVPLMLARYFYLNQNNWHWGHLLAIALLLLLPFGLIARQPDLGTALLVFATGFCVIYFAGLSLRLLLSCLLLLAALLALLLAFEEQICRPGVDWVLLHDYQKHRICTLLNPGSDPLGRGFHTLQAMIAIGSGGMYGKGYMQGTQSHLDFIPERTTDFIFAVFAEEFGLYGGVMLLALYALVILRGLVIAFYAQTLYERLLAGALSMMFFVYVFVNVGMVTGMLPVVGVPLPLMSYGGTALLTLGVASGILMNISRRRALEPSTRIGT